MIHVITGGSGSGKSAYAEDWLIRHRGPGISVYLATMQPWGEEGLKKIRRHRKLRDGKGFVTVECCRNLTQTEIPESSAVLLECVSNLAANTLFQEDGKMKDAEDALKEILDGIRHLTLRTKLLVIVTNEINSDVNGYSGETEAFRQLMGTVNQELARMADQITEVVYGIPVPVKK